MDNDKKNNYSFNDLLNSLYEEENNKDTNNNTDDMIDDMLLEAKLFSDIESDKVDLDSNNDTEVKEINIESNDTALENIDDNEEMLATDIDENTNDNVNDIEDSESDDDEITHLELEEDNEVDGNNNTDDMIDDMLLEAKLFSDIEGDKVDLDSNNDNEVKEINIESNDTALENIDDNEEMLATDIDENTNDNMNDIEDSESDDVVSEKDDSNREIVNEDQTEKSEILDDNFKEKDNKEENKIVRFLSDKRVYTILIILIFLLSCVLVGKTFYLRNKVDDYESLIIDIEKESDEITVYSDNNNIPKVGNGAANELINCLNYSVDVNDLPEEINSIVEEIHNYYNSSNEYFAYVYKDIFTGFTVGYNENQNIFTASAIKGPTDIYIYEKASTGEIDLDENLTYTSNYYNTGSGLLKDKEFNTNYSVRKLLELSTVYSDNAAHNMLTDHFGRDNMYNFWNEKGTTAIFSQNTNWGILNAKDSSIYMNELYNFYSRDEVYGKEVMNNFINAIPKFISSEDNYTIANKSGWSGSVLHDVAIVFADNPYIVVALSNTGASGNYMEYFNEVSKLSSKLHTAYWKYKVSTCENIKQY